MKQAFKKSTQLSIATVSEYRNAIFPVSKNLETGDRQSNWGTFKVERSVGVTARHRDVLDAIIAKAIKKEYVPNSITRELELHLLFDAKSVLDLLNTKADYRWLRKMLYDLQAMVISIQKKDGIWPESWSLVSYIGETLVDAERKPGQLKAKLKKIVLSPGAVKWMSENMKIIMDIKVLEKIFLLENEVSRAVARWFLSHATSQNHGINSVLDAVGCNTETSKEIKRRISQLENDSEILEALGITLGANVNSKRIAGVSFKK